MPFRVAARIQESAHDLCEHGVFLLRTLRLRLPLDAGSVRISSLELQRSISNWAHGVVASHPLSMQVSTFHRFCRLFSFIIRSAIERPKRTKA